MAKLDLEHAFIIEQNPEEALSQAMQKQDMSRQAGDEKGRAVGLIKAGDALVCMGKPDDAMGLVMEAMALCGEMKFEEGRAAAMNVMSKVHLKKGRDAEELEEAMDSAMDTLKLFRKLGYRKGEAVALLTLSDVFYSLKDSSQCVQNAKEALAIFSELGERTSMAEVYRTIMRGHLVKAPPSTFHAAKALEKAMAIYEELGDKSKAASAMHTIGKIELQGGEPKKAVEAVTKAGELYVACGDFQGQAMTMETIMNMYIEAGMYVEAIKIGKARCGVFHNAGDMQGEGKALVRLGAIMLENEDYDRAGKVAEVALGIFAGLNDATGVQDAKDLLDGAKHARVTDEISLAINKCSGITHIPATLIVDPGLNKRIQQSYSTAMAG